MVNEVLAGLGLAGSLLGQQNANKAAKRQADAYREAASIEDKRIRELSQPYLDMFNWAKPKMQDMAGRYGSRIGKESDLLSGSHDLNLSNIDRNKNKSLASSGMFWDRLGNSGKARGEALQIEQNATDATNRENLTYGQSQENYKDRNMASFMDSLNGMLSTGTQGTQLAIQGAGTLAGGMRDAATIEGNQMMDNASAYGDIGGSLISSWMAGMEQKKLMELLNGVQKK